MPVVGSGPLRIDFDDIYYFIRSTEKQAQNWERTCRGHQGTWGKLGIPRREKKYLGGVSAQYESEVVYHKIREELDQIGVIFTDMDSALRDYPTWSGVLRHDIPSNDNKFRRAEHGWWSAGLRLRARGRQRRHPAAGVLPHQPGEHGSVRADADHRRAGSYVHYVGGWQRADLHERLAALGLVEIIAKPGSRVRYTTIQNWSTNVYNLVTKPGRRVRGRRHGWIDGNIGRSDDEVTRSILPARQRRAWRGAFGGAFAGEGIAHRCWRQGDPLRAVHVVGHHLQVRSAKAARAPATVAWSASSQWGAPRQVDRGWRRAHPGMSSHVRTRTRT